MTLVTRTPRFCKPCAMGCTTAVPTPPPMQSAWPVEIISVGWPSGPATSRMKSPGWSATSSLVLLPTAWMTSVIAPVSGLESAMVSGMRSEFSARWTMTNCPACRIWAMRGA